ncbi:MAG: hypothetical protein M1352_03380 [Patescibacteria group bacterium]|nr:hypothetical protein [Patescibacteria group bacterium]
MSRRLSLAILALSVSLIIAGLAIKAEPNRNLSQNNTGLIAGKSVNPLDLLDPSVPVFPQASVSSSLSATGRLSLTLESSQSAEKILKYYREELDKRGWVGGPQDYQMDGRTLSVRVIPAKDKEPSIILLNYTLVPTK